MNSLPPIAETAARTRGRDEAGPELLAVDGRADFQAMLADVTREPRTSPRAREEARFDRSGNARSAPAEVSGAADSTASLPDASGFAENPLATDSIRPPATVTAAHGRSSAEAATSAAPAGATTGGNGEEVAGPLEPRLTPGPGGGRATPAIDGMARDPLSRTAPTDGLATPSGVARPGAAVMTPVATASGPAMLASTRATTASGSSPSAPTPATTPSVAITPEVPAAPAGGQTGSAPGARNGGVDSGRAGDASGHPPGDPGHDRSTGGWSGRSVPTVIAGQPGTSERPVLDPPPGGAGEPRLAPPAVAAEDARPTRTPTAGQRGSPAEVGTHVDTARELGVNVAETTLSGAEGPSRVTTSLPTAMRERLSPADFVERVRDLVARQSAGGRTEVRLALDPPTLGQVRLRITQVGESIRLQLMVDNAAAARALERQMPGLTRALARLGTTLEEASVRLAELPGAVRPGGGGQSQEQTKDQQSTLGAERDAGEMGGGSSRRHGPADEERFAELVGDVPASDGRARRAAPGAGSDAAEAERPTHDGIRGRTVDRIA